ncbi:MAG: hypothetical protein RMM53_05035 [Bacteroidia bacterium]|nr:hypothetical protein [Bacteroidia bacterium]MDW8333563.1 hypothetical protein [Bacteroidia bacterium]
MKTTIAIVVLAFVAAGEARAQSEADFWGKWTVAEVKVEQAEQSPSDDRTAVFIENFKKSAYFEFFKDGKATVSAFGQSGEGLWRFNSKNQTLTFSAADNAESVPVRFLDSGAMELIREIPGGGKMTIYLVK